MRFKRTPFYCASLFTALLETLFGTMASFIDGRSPYLYIFGKIAVVLSILTWIWIGVLLRYNNKSVWTHTLTRSLSHFTSFTVLSIIWLAIGVMLATQTTYECDAKTLWCAISSFSTVLAFLTGVFSTIAAIIIWIGANESGAGLSVNVAELNNRVLDSDA